MTSTSPSELEQLRKLIREFATERDWDQFNTPKNLSMALSVEAAELMEHFQWKVTGDLVEIPVNKHQALRYEMADVFIYLIRLADKMETDLYQAVLEKLEINRQKYPVEKVKGDSRKYSEYE